jgi:hypothetical protein
MMLELKNKEKKFYLPEFGICEFHPKSAVEEKAIELVWLYLYIATETAMETEFSGEAVQEIIERKLKELADTVMLSKMEPANTKSGLIEGVPHEIVVQNTFRAASAKNLKPIQ